MRRTGIVWQVFISILAVSLLSILATGVVARRTLSTAFEAYLAAADTHMGSGMGRGMGQLFLGAAEQSFLAGVDRGIRISAAIAVAFAALAALLLARYLTRPIRGLTAGAKAVAAGDLDHRVEVTGPAEYEELAEAFNDMARSLQTSESLRQRMVSDVAHELRNPIAALRAQAEAVAEGVLPLDAERIDSMVEDLAHLSRLVSELQELSGAESGTLRYDRERFDICDLVRREVDRASLLTSGDVELSCSCPQVPVTVDADGFRIAQVLRNLLGNAVRHTAHGSITAIVEPMDAWVRVSVRDTGEGIPEKDLPYIFERFYRADTARAASTGGTGLGLAIAKRIIEDHGGQVFAASTPGVGSVIGFTLPIAAQQS
ncbi:MAG: HAMP domain-containing sensor histidine kinase [Coriobacteriales bacterium]